MNPDRFTETYDRYSSAYLFLQACTMGNIRCTAADLLAGIERLDRACDEMEAEQGNKGLFRGMASLYRKEALELAEEKRQ